MTHEPIFMPEFVSRLTLNERIQISDDGEKLRATGVVGDNAPLRMKHREFMLNHMPEVLRRYDVGAMLELLNEVHRHDARQVYDGRAVY